MKAKEMSTEQILILVAQIRPTENQNCRCQEYTERVDIDFSIPIPRHCVETLGKY